MTTGNWSRSDKMSLAALLIASLSLVASVSLIIVFSILWLRSPVDMQSDQTSQTQPPDNVTTEDAKRDQTPPPDNPTTQNRNDPKQPQSKTYPTPQADKSTTQNRSEKQPQSKTKGAYDGSPSEPSGTRGPVVRVGEEGVRAPSIVYRVEPTYSEEARRAKYQGVVVLSAIVRRDGGIEILKVVRGLGLGLDENAIAALKQWKFRPGTKNGVPVDVALNVEVNFSLR